MAEPTPGFQASEGTPDQLPRGAAAAANEGTDVTPDAGLNPDLSAPAESPAPAQPQAEVSDPELATPADYEPAPNIGSEDDAFLTDATSRPQESVTTGAVPTARPPLPPDFQSWFPMFQEAAGYADAPLQLRVLVEYLRQISG